MTNYPDSQDNIFTLPTVSGDTEEAIAINALQEAVLAIEAELGNTPSGVYSTVKNKLDIIESRVIVGSGGSYDGYILDGRIDELEAITPAITPYQFGGVGDGVADDTAALALWAAAGSTASTSCYLHLPDGIWRTTATITFTSGPDNYHALKLTGSNGMVRAAKGSVIRYVGTATANPIVRFVGLTGSLIEDIVFDCNSLSDGVLADISPTYGSSSGVTFNRCLVLYPREQAGGSAMAVGPVIPTPSTQSDTFAWNDCLFIVQESLSSSVNVDCWKTNQNGNTKNFSLHNCSFYGGRRAINWALGSGMLTISGNGSIGGCGTDIYQGGGQLVVLSSQSERSGRMLTQIGNFSSADIRGWEWHGGRECTDNIVISAAGGRVSVQGSSAINYRGQRVITGVNTTSNVISFNGDENSVGLSITNEPIEVRSTVTLPAPLVAGTVYYVRDHTSLGGGLFTCKLSATEGGAEIDITSAGSGSLSFVSPVKITCSGTQQAASSVVGSFESRQNFWDCAIDHLPIFEGANDLLGAQYAIASNANGNATNIVSHDDFGGQAAAPVRLRNIDGAILERSAQQVLLTTAGGSLLYSGAAARAWHVERFRYTDMTDADTAQDIYRRFPARAIITQCLVEIVTPFVNASGSTTLNIYEAYAFGTIITACNLEAAAGTVYGLTNAERGTRWVNEVGAFPAVGVGGYTWDLPWLALLNFVTVGANVNALSAGECIISIEYTIPPRS